MKELTNINIDNYEHWFLLLVDGELRDVGQRKALYEFLSRHPHLERELDILKATVQQPDEEIVYPAKNKLLKVSDETLMLYLDGELSQEDKLWVEAVLEQGDAQPLQELQKVYLQPDLSITCPHKEKLYKKAPVSHLSSTWLKIAVAAVFAGVLLAIYFTFYGKQEEAVPLAAKSQQSRSEEHLFTKDTVPTGFNKLAIAVSPHTKLVHSQEQRNIKGGSTDVPQSTILQEKSSKVSTAIVREQENIEVQDPLYGLTAVVKDAPDIHRVKEPESLALDVTPAVDIDRESIAIVHSDIIPSSPQEVTTSKKKKSLIKNLGKNIKNRALDILTNGEDEVIIAGFAVNITNLRNTEK